MRLDRFVKTAANDHSDLVTGLVKAPIGLGQLGKQIVVIIEMDVLPGETQLLCDGTRDLGLLTWVFLGIVVRREARKLSSELASGQACNGAGVHAARKSQRDRHVTAQTNLDGIR